VTTADLPLRAARSGETAWRNLPGLPMPRNLAQLRDTEQRPRVLRNRRGRFPFPIPNGWFIVAAAADLMPGEVVPLYYFGRELVLFRGTDGAAHLLDAHCPHLGAHLGVGGQVEESCIRCPFHGWKFDGASGRCVDVPYDDVEYIPKTATARSYPVVERNQMIWAWHHLRHGEPFYEVPEVPEFADPEWLPIVVRDFEVATCAQEMAENNVDRAHFKYVHGTDAIPDEEFEGYGLGLGVLRLRGRTTFVSSTTPVDADNVHVRWIFTAPVSLGADAAEKAADTFCEGVSQDLPIWENKIYKEPPVLRPSEKDVTDQRRWARQFYCLPDQTPAEAEETS
jgi:nitrite reductase/ring-hydroxylating ferredoxin subunit